MDKVLIVTATKVEAQEVLDQFTRTTGAKGEPCYIGRKTYYPLGDIGGVDLFMVQSEMGTSTPAGSLLTISKAIDAISPVAVIMVGICFGARPDNQEIGQILVSKQLHSYEPKRETVKGRISRGDKVTASEALLDKFRSADLLWKGVPIHFGLILSGEKLIDNPVFLQELLEEEPEAIGGEMEGAGLYVAAHHACVDWIIVKAICDWADGKKNNKFQRKAAQNAVAFVLHVIQQGGLEHLRLSEPENGPSSHSLGKDIEETRLPGKESDEKHWSVRSTIPGRYGKPFVGRDDELAEMLDKLGDTSREMVLVLHGQSGAGKSELGFEFARIQQARYPGGTFLIRAGSVGAAVDLAGVGKNILGLQFAPDLRLEDQCQKTLHALGSAATLLVYDNVIEPDEIRDLLPHAGRPCHVIVTTVVDRWPPNWPIIHVHPLPDEKAFDLVKAIGGAAITEKYGQRLVEFSKGLPIQICPMAEILKREHDRGLDESVEFSLSNDAMASFKGVYDRLNADQRLLLHAAARLNPQRIRRDELFRSLSEPEVMNDHELIRALDACMDLTLLQGGHELRMHQLRADFLLGVPLPNDQVETFRKVRQTQAEHFVEVAREFINGPGDPNLAGKLTAFSLSIEAWSGIEYFSGDQDHWIGCALYELGRWADGLPWFERAVQAAEKGDTHGRVDHQTLGASFHQVGMCHSKLGNFREALPWFERAIETAEKGDSNGMVDHQFLGTSVGAVGTSYLHLGKFEDALPWLQRSVEAAKRGDINGRVDYESLGRSLCHVGMCYFDLGKFEDAIPWFELAVEATKRGNIYGGVDHESLGASLHEVGMCYWRLGRSEDAKLRFDQAAKVKEKGDIHGRVNHESLGRSLHQVGMCYFDLGKFKEALPWFERAVQAKEKGDVHGRVDQQSIGASHHPMGLCYTCSGQFEQALQCFRRGVEAQEKGDIHGRVNHEYFGRGLHQMGTYYSNLGEFKEALPWFERAVQAKEKGDIHGRVDHRSLGTSVHEVGMCYYDTGEFKEAFSWFERAVKAAEKGDTYSRVDHASLGKSVHQVGMCYAKLGKVREALPWFERAVKANEKGDIYGRVDEESLRISSDAVKGCLEQINKS